MLVQLFLFFVCERWRAEGAYHWSFSLCLRLGDWKLLTIELPIARTVYLFCIALRYTFVQFLIVDCLICRKL